MAIRDRVAVHTRDGRDLSMTVTRQGGSIEVIWPRKREENLEVRMLDKNGGPTGESIVVGGDNIASVVTDSAPKEAKKK